MVEPLLSTHAFAGAQKTESSKLHYACIGTWFVPGRNIQLIHVRRSQLPSYITCIGLRRRWRFASSPLCRLSFIMPAMVYVGHVAQPFNLAKQLVMLRLSSCHLIRNNFPCHYLHFLYYYYYYNYYYYCCCCRCLMLKLIVGFTCPPTVNFKFIRKCDRYYTKCDDYYKVRQNKP